MTKVHIRQSGPEAHHSCHQPECCPGAPPTHVSLPADGEIGLHHHEAVTPTTMGAFKRSLLWFLTFFGIYASSSMCPFCGTPGCPVGAGSAALVGGFFAALWQYGRNIWESLKRMVARLKG